MRTLALAAIACLSFTNGAQAAPSSAGRLEFEVLRNGEPFGRHTVVVSGSGPNLRAQTNVVLRAGAGPVTLYRYEQSCSETWNSGALAAIDCNTLKDGRRTRVRGAVQGSELRITGARGEMEFALDIAPTSWWTRPAVYARSMLNTETGDLMAMRVTRMGRETIDAGGERIQADRVRVQGTLAVDLWYDAQGRWVGCAFTVRNQRIEYRLASPLSAAPS